MFLTIGVTEFIRRHAGRFIIETVKRGLRIPFGAGEANVSGCFKTLSGLIIESVPETIALGDETVDQFWISCR